MVGRSPGNCSAVSAGEGAEALLLVSLEWCRSRRVHTGVLRFSHGSRVDLFRIGAAICFELLLLLPTVAMMMVVRLPVKNETVRPCVYFSSRVTSRSTGNDERKQAHLLSRDELARLFESRLSRALLLPPPPSCVSSPPRYRTENLTPFFAAFPAIVGTDGRFCNVTAADLSSAASSPFRSC